MLWQYLKKADKPILLYGMGNGADKILNALEELSIPVRGVFASDGFVRNKVFRGFKLMSYSEAKADFGSMIVLLSFGTQRPDDLELIRRVASEQELYCPDVPVYGRTLFNLEYAKAHSSQLEAVYGRLSDEQSRKVFRNVIESKLTGRIEPLFNCETSPDEAFENILRLTDSEIYMDLGAYNGDTVLDFTSRTASWRHIYALEPDKKNFTKLTRNLEDIPNCTLLNVGAHNCSETINFRNNSGRNSAVSSSGVPTAMNSVDNILAKSPATYIKMDVEGQERLAIEGSSETIIRFKPKLLVSAYHRSEDIFALPLQILALRPDYKLYMRHYPYLPAWDTNYYFV